MTMPLLPYQQPEPVEKNGKNRHRSRKSRRCYDRGYFPASSATSVTLLLLFFNPNNRLVASAAGWIPQSHRQHHRRLVSRTGKECDVVASFWSEAAPTVTGVFALHAKPKNVDQQQRSSDDSVVDPPTIPANLRRKVTAKRPPLGHVVPKNSNHRPGAVMGGSAPSQLKPQGQKQQRSTTPGDAPNNVLNNPSNLKIVAGSARGRRLDSPSVYLRPMMGKVREAVFSTLTSFGLYDRANGATRHLDIFAGSGSVGLESLSRGAAFCAFVDFSEDCCATIRRNLRHCQFASDDDDNDNNRRATVICADYLQALRNPAAVGFGPDGATAPFQLVTLCPPYEEVVYAELLQAVVESPLVTDDTVVLVEYPIELGCLPHVIVSSNQNDDAAAAAAAATTAVSKTMVGVRNRRYGRTVIAIYVVNPTGKLETAESRPEEFVTV